MRRQSDCCCEGPEPCVSTANCFIQVDCGPRGITSFIDCTVFTGTQFEHHWTFATTAVLAFAGPSIFNYSSANPGGSINVVATEDGNPMTVIYGGGQFETGAGISCVLDPPPFSHMIGTVQVHFTSPTIGENVVRWLWCHSNHDPAPSCPPTGAYLSTGPGQFPPQTVFITTPTFTVT